MTTTIVATPNSMYHMLVGKSNFEIAKLINARAGRPRLEEISKQAFLNQVDLIQSELNEIYQGVEENNLEQVRDAIVDVLLVTYGLGAVANIDVNSDYLIMTEANLTRIDNTIEDALQTQAKWMSRGIQCDIHENPQPDGTVLYPVRTINEDQVDAINGEKFSKNKFLKSHLFRQPVYGPDTFKIVA